MAFSKASTCQYLLLLFVFLDVATASPSSRLKPRQEGNTESQNILPDGTLNCETERSADYYGLGVRLGVYFAWFQAWIANACVPSEISSALDTNAVFLFAILVSMIRCSITGMLLQVDGLLLMHLAGGTIFSVLSLWGYRTCSYDIYGPQEGIKRFGGWGTHFRLLLSMAISCFGFFFWVWGIKGGLNGDDFPDCQIVYTFFFTKLRADGGIRILYIIICVACMIYFGIMLLVSLTALPTRLHFWRVAHHEGDTGDRVRSKFATGLTQRRLRQIFYFCRIGNFIFIIWSMLLVEFTLNFNHMAMVLGTRGGIMLPAQIIPTIVGIFGFCRVIWVRYREWKSPDYLHTDTKRTILKPNKELMRIYTAKSNVSLDFANRRSDNEIDPVMKGQSIALQCLVSWLPWLAVHRWWKPDNTHNQDHDHNGSQSQPLASDESKDVESPGLLSPASTWAGDTPKLGHTQHRDTWASDDTIASRTGTQLPDVPKGISRFGSLKG